MTTDEKRMTHEEWLLEAGRFRQMLKERQVKDGETLRGHLATGLQRVIARLCPEGSWGPGVGAVGVTLLGYDKTIKNANGVRLSLPSGEEFIITVEQTEQ